MYDFEEHPDYNPKKVFQILSFNPLPVLPNTPTLVISELEEYLVIEQSVPTIMIRREERFGGVWVARYIETGVYIDKDQYRHDLFERLEMNRRSN